ncbi:hypothetical protein HYPSUDRAFT_32557 [Hypholoma sublateritium FD-334 SS-4]|uniref:Uncharacterized protein n=1 Tax=Hypholoma sublateritium (strain FD-334 SS-4) TaxID=945553 RepID=A0A0D2PLI1_HYPSF|nr:hypothetical protein HYPSUDRAFT_32557 [Hypholoma sublateritium FD-334 SS-4]
MADGLLVRPNKFKESRGRSSITKLRFKKGQNLYSVAYNYYSEGLSEPPPGPNYISNDGIRSKRHEYLGPAPCVAGFLLTENDTEILLFWDAYLKVAWAHQNTWRIEAEFDEKVEAWFPIIRFTST